MSAAKRAYELWSEAESSFWRGPVKETGGLMIGPSDSKTVAGALRSAQECNLDIKCSFDEMRKRYPQFILKEDEIALFEESWFCSAGEKLYSSQSAG